jgi:hypothetical protein
VVPQLKVGKVARSALWLVAEFADTPQRAAAALELLAPLIPALDQTVTTNSLSVTSPFLFIFSLLMPPLLGYSPSLWRTGYNPPRGPSVGWWVLFSYHPTFRWSFIIPMSSLTL